MSMSDWLHVVGECLSGSELTAELRRVRTPDAKWRTYVSASALGHPRNTRPTPNMATVNLHFDSLLDTWWICTPEDVGS